MGADRPEYAGPAKGGGWRVSVWVQPGAKRTELAGLHGGYLKNPAAGPGRRQQGQQRADGVRGRRSRNQGPAGGHRVRARVPAKEPACVHRGRARLERFFRPGI